MKDFVPKVFGWLFVGLLVTFVTSFLVFTNEWLLRLIFSNSMYLIIFIAEIGVAVALGAGLNKMKPTTMKILYVLYSVLTGLTFSSIFVLFEVTSIMFIFLVTAVIFGVFALIGRVTKIDLSKFSTFLIMSLLGVIVLEVINIFIMNNTLDMVLCIVSLIIFMGYIAFDMQRITRIEMSGFGNENLAIYGAFQLYLDFINIFIRLLNLFGKERD